MEMELFLMGSIGMAWAVAALFFFRFWHETGDRLFLMFAIAFCLLGATRVIMAMMPDPREEHTHLYWVRLAAYLLIVVAIVDKNRPRATRTA